MPTKITIAAIREGAIVSVGSGDRALLREGPEVCFCCTKAPNDEQISSLIHLFSSCLMLLQLLFNLGSISFVVYFWFLFWILCQLYMQSSFDDLLIKKTSFLYSGIKFPSHQMGIKKSRWRFTSRFASDLGFTRPILISSLLVDYEQFL